MTMTPAEVERKVRQLDNDVQSIHELLSDLQSGMTRIDATLTRHGNHFSELAQRLDAHDQRFDGLDAKMDEVLTLLRAR